MASYGTCSYESCPNTYSTDSDVTFFKFPLENPRRKKWIVNCGNPEIGQLSDRQLRGRRLCSDHFEKSAFITSTSKETLSNKAVPIMYVPGKSISVKKEEEEREDAPTAGLASPAVKKRSVGRPPKTPVSVKQEVSVEESSKASKSDISNKNERSVADKDDNAADAPTESVKRRAGRPRKSVEVEPKASKEKSAGRGKIASDQTPKKSADGEDMEVPEIAPILSGRILRHRSGDAGRPAAAGPSGVAVKVTPILDQIKREPEKRGRGRPPRNLSTGATASAKHEDGDASVGKRKSTTTTAAEVIPTKKIKEERVLSSKKVKEEKESLVRSVNEKTRADAEEVQVKMEIIVSQGGVKEESTEKPEDVSSSNINSNVVIEEQDESETAVNGLATDEVSKAKTSIQAKPVAQNFDGRKSGQVGVNARKNETNTKAMPRKHGEMKRTGKESSEDAKPKEAGVMPKPAGVSNITVKSEEGTQSHGRKSDGKRAFSDQLGFDKLNLALKQKCVEMFSGWAVSGVLFDTFRKIKMMAITEMQLSASGSLEIRRSVKLFEDMSVKVYINEEDVSNKFETRVSGELDVTKLITRVSLVKICPGIKNFQADDSAHHPTAVKKSHGWFAYGCPIIADSYGGPLCVPCAKLRNALRRRRAKERSETEKRIVSLNSNLSSGSGRGVQSNFGKCLYNMFESLLEPPKIPKASAAAAADVTPCTPISESLIQEHQSESVNGIGPTATPKNRRAGSSRPSGTAKKRTAGGQNKNTATVTAVDVQDGSARTTFDERMTAAVFDAEEQREFNPDCVGMGQVVSSGPFLEDCVRAEENNVVIQNGIGFTLAEGQEYELIGEAEPSAQRPQYQQFGNETYEVVEVDAQTMAQLAAQSGQLYLPNNSNLQVTEIDPFDPNNQHLIKVLTPSEFFAQVS